MEDLKKAIIRLKKINSKLTALNQKINISNQKIKQLEKQTALLKSNYHKNNYETLDFIIKILDDAGEKLCLYRKATREIVGY